MLCEPRAAGVTQGHCTGKIQLLLSLSSCNHQHGAFTLPSAGEWQWHHTPQHKLQGTESTSAELSLPWQPRHSQFLVFLSTGQCRLSAHTPLQSLCNAQTRLSSAWSFKGLLGHAKPHCSCLGAQGDRAGTPHVVPAPLCGLPRAVHKSTQRCSSHSVFCWTCMLQGQLLHVASEICPSPVLFLSHQAPLRANTAPTPPTLPALTSACPPGVRVLLQRSHLRQNLCQSLPREDTFSAAGDTREG